MELSIIIVNWNSAEYLLKCLKSIFEQPPNASYEVIVVDNASSGDDIAQVKQSYSSVRVIASSQNLGFARANNLGFTHASGEYVLFLNPDTELVGPAVDILLRTIRSLPDAGVVGCRLLNTDRSVQLSAIQKFPTLLGQVFDAEWLIRRWPDCPLWRLGPLFRNDPKPVQVDSISGACMLLRREVFTAVRMLSEDYFMYAEDVELSYKTSRAAFRNYYVGEAVIVHHGGKSSSEQIGKQWSTIMKCNAMLQYFCKTRGRLYGALYCVAMGCVALGRLSLLSLWYPICVGLDRKSSARLALKKWVTVLSWSVGLSGVAMQREI